jgi:hypothetical protein
VRIEHALQNLAVDAAIDPNAHARWKLNLDQAPRWRR